VRTSPAVAVADPLRAAHDRLLVEVAALTTSGDWLAYLGAMRRFHRYSATNVLMIMSQRPDASLVAGFGTWKRMGRHVRKGARGIAIWAPMLRRATDAADDAGARLYGFRLAHVFDVADTDGSPLPAPPKRARATLLGGAAPEGMWDELVRQAATAGFEVVCVDAIDGSDGANGMTSYAARRIELALEGRSPASLAKTLAHELAHVALHEGCSYLERREQLEVEAESVAFLVCAAFGLDAMDYSLGYVSNWSGGDPDVVLRTADTVRNCARVVVEQAGRAGVSLDAYGIGQPPVCD